METRMPTTQEIDQLVSFLPRLYSEGFSPIKRCESRKIDQDGVIAIPWPEYDEVVEEFFQFASSECWSDYDYCPEEAARMLKSDELVRSADLAQIKTILTYCVRGERFCVGHWESIIVGGYLRRLLNRLAEIRKCRTTLNILAT